jgi:hypothetical protein
MSITIPTVIIERKFDIVTVNNKDIENTKDVRKFDYSSGLLKSNIDYFKRRQKL